MKKITNILLLSLLAVATAQSAPQAAPQADKVTLLFTHDLHSTFTPRTEVVKGHADKVVTLGGYAKLSTAIQKERGRNSQAVNWLLDAGDFSMGTVYHTLYETEASELRLMGSMGYDATTLGNHDFDYHLTGLNHTLQKAKSSGERLPAIVASNIVWPASVDLPEVNALRETMDQLPVRGKLVLERGGLKLGLIGLMGVDATEDAPFAKPLKFSNIVEAARPLVRELRDKDKVDLVVVLSHAGTMPSSLDGDGTSNSSEDVVLARKVPGIDVIISGHTHRALVQPVRVNNTLIVGASAYGRYLGVLELERPKTEANWKALGYRLEAMDESVPEDAAIRARIEGFARILDERFMAISEHKIHEEITRLSFPMPEHAVRRPGQIMRNGGETALGDMITDAFRWAVYQADPAAAREPLIAVEPDGVIRNSLVPEPWSGVVRFENIFQTLSLGLGRDGLPGYPLLNIYLYGHEIKDLLEVETTISMLKPDAHLQLSGLQFRFNPKRVPFDRVTEILIEDPAQAQRLVPLQKERLYRLVCNSYTATVVHVVDRLSKGLLSLVARDSTGAPLKDLQVARLDRAPKIEGVQEFKEWDAFAQYLKSFKDGVPQRYRLLAQRIVEEPSWNPIKIFSGVNAITWGAFLILSFALLSFAGVGLWLWTRIKRAKQRLRQS